MKNAEIINKIYKNEKLNHFAANKKWYIKNDLLYVYDDIMNKTFFLNDYSDVTLRERIFYIEKDFNELLLCKYCNIRKLNFYKNTVNFSKSCGDLTCRKKQQSIISKNMWENYDKNKLDERNKKISKKHIGKKLSDSTIEKIRIANIGRVQSDYTKKLRVTTRRNNGMPWHTKSTVEKIRKANKIVHNSREFKEKYKDIYEKSHKKISNTMKRKILNGKFTPCITNSWTKWKAYVNHDNNKIKFRSNWDAAFWILNTELEYETIRIKYYINNNWYSYIVDFHDKKNKRLYEIKPKSLKENKINKIKFKAAEDWCNELGYKFIIIDDDWFSKYANNIDYTTQPQLLKPMAQFL